MNLRKILMFGLVPLGLAGCAVQPPPVTAAPGPTEFQQALTDSVHDIDHQLALLNAVNGASTTGYYDGSTGPQPLAPVGGAATGSMVRPPATPASYRTTETKVTGPLAKVVSFRWNGPLDPAVGAIATRIGWKYSVLGRTPATPVYVAVNEQPRSWYDVLHILADQTGPDCTVSVDAATQHISVIYASVSPGIHDGGPAFRTQQAMGSE